MKYLKANFNKKCYIMLYMNIIVYAIFISKLRIFFKNF